MAPDGKARLQKFPFLQPKGLPEEEDGASMEQTYDKLMTMIQAIL
jgi:hypothetical protein